MTKNTTPAPRTDRTYYDEEKATHFYWAPNHSDIYDGLKVVFIQDLGLKPYGGEEVPFSEVKYCVQVGFIGPMGTLLCPTSHLHSLKES